MFTMQAFHAQLFSDSQTNKAYMQSLVRLTQVDLSQVANLDDVLSWTQWWSEEG